MPPSAVRQMTLPEIYQLFDYWRYSPPAHEILAILAAATTTWKPEPEPQTEDEMRAHQQKLWQSGAAMSVADLYKTMGRGRTGRDMPGIGRFPGA